MLLFVCHMPGNKDVLEMVSSDMEQRTVESGTALTFEPKMTRARTKQAFDSGRFCQAPRDGACGDKEKGLRRSACHQ